MKLINTECPICKDKDNFKIIYKENFNFSDFNTNIFSARRLPDNVHYRIVKCKTCNLLRSNPIINSEYLGELYKTSLLTYEEEIENLAITYLNTIKIVLNKISKEENILEIGCGNGFLLNELYKNGYKNVYGVEPSMDAVNKAYPAIQERIKISIFDKGLYKEKSFKFIYFFQTFDHIEDPKTFLDGCYKLLESGGYILSFNHDVNNIINKFFGEKSPIIDIEHIFLYSPSTIKKIFEKNNFQILKIFSPFNIISLQHFFWLLPLPGKIKNKILHSKNTLLKKRIKLKIGNLCLIALKK
jgi:2-polyprenyl-3-methyl-5-hydroxy-6-metoxy-1,4-benzoquinol methylase